MTRRLALVLLLAAALGASAGIASGSGGSRGPRDPQRDYNPADESWARAIRVQRSDLGKGWKLDTSSGEEDPETSAVCRKPDLSDLVATGEAETPDFSRGGSFVDSGSSVFRNERDARVAWDRTVGKPLVNCTYWAFRAGVESVGARVRAISSGKLALPKLAPGFVAWQVRFSIKGRAATMNGRLDLYLFRRGRATALLLVISFDRPLTPVSQALERKLAGLTAERMRR